MGEPSGIGPEVAVAAYIALDGHIGAHKLKLVGDPDVFRACGKVPDGALIATQAKAKRVPGTLNVASSRAVIEAIELAVEAAMAGEAGAVVTAPIHKSVLTESGFAFPGHTEFLAHLTGAKHAVMMMASDKLKVVPLTIHIPVREVPSRLSKESIVETGEIILASLKSDFAIARPRLAIAGLNPHAGEAGTIGMEEDTIICPAIEELTSKGHVVTGPHSADTMFHDEARALYDAALCMFHDQALIPSKTLAFWDGVNVTLGLPIVRTSPDHGTALDIAGTGKADVRSMIAAIKRAAQMADARG
jgi:4-hydroxythreonine-4-phosphate dehydrogenase